MPIPAIMEVMEKRRSSKIGKAPKVTTRKKPDDQSHLASRELAFSGAVLKDIRPHLAKERDPLPSKNEVITDIPVIEDFTLEQAPWHVFSGRTSPTSEGNVDQMIDRATEVMGDKQEALRWLGTPVRGLDFATPISLLATEEGAQRVNDILIQMEHGVW